MMGNKPVCLMRGHGVTVVGRGVEHATLNTIDLNELCTMTYKAYVLGNPKPVLDEDIAEYRSRRSRIVHAAPRAAIPA